MKRKCFWLTNHQPTIEQVDDLKERGFSLLEASQELKALFCKVPTDCSYEQWLGIFKQALLYEMRDSSCIVIQGEMVTVFRLVTMLKDMGIECLASISERVSEETRLDDGTTIKTSVFRHVSYRRY